VSPAVSFSCSGRRAACGIEIIAADTAASTVVVARVSRAGCSRHGSLYNLRMIKDRPHRLDLIYINEPLYFITFATRDRRSSPSMGCGLKERID